MTNHKNRLAKLEKYIPTQPATPDPAALRASIMAKMEAILSGEVLPVYPMTPEREEIERRLDRIAALSGE